jgi:hypothetical protein
VADDKNNPPKDPEKFDRVEYMRQIRRECLKRLDLPEDAKPEMVLTLLKIKEELELAKNRKDDQKH